MDVVVGDVIGEELTVVVGVFEALVRAVFVPLDEAFDDAVFAGGLGLVVVNHIVGDEIAVHRVIGLAVVDDFDAGPGPAGEPVFFFGRESAGVGDNVAGHDIAVVGAESCSAEVERETGQRGIADGVVGKRVESRAVNHFDAKMVAIFDRVA